MSGSNVVPLLSARDLHSGACALCHSLGTLPPGTQPSGCLLPPLGIIIDSSTPSPAVPPLGPHATKLAHSPAWRAAADAALEFAAQCAAYLATTSSSPGGAHLSSSRLRGLADENLLAHWTLGHAPLPEYRRAYDTICVVPQFMGSTMLLRHVREASTGAFRDRLAQIKVCGFMHSARGMGRRSELAIGPYCHASIFRKPRPKASRLPRSDEANGRSLVLSAKTCFSVHLQRSPRPSLEAAIEAAVRKAYPCEGGKCGRYRRFGFSCMRGGEGSYFQICRHWRTQRDLLHPTGKSRSIVLPPCTPLPLPITCHAGSRPPEVVAHKVRVCYHALEKWKKPFYTLALGLIAELEPDRSAVAAKLSEVIHHHCRTTCT